MSARYPPTTPSQLTGEQKEVHDYLTKAFGSLFGDRFIWHDENDALVGPFALLLSTSLKVAKGFYYICEGLGSDKRLPQAPREIAILAAGAHFKAGYELYAHAHVAETVEGLTKEQIERVVKGEKPGDGSDLDLAFQISQTLVKQPGALDSKLHKAAVDAFGDGAMVLVCRAQFLILDVRGINTSDSTRTRRSCSTLALLKCPKARRCCRGIMHRHGMIDREIRTRDQGSTFTSSALTDAAFARRSAASSAALRRAAGSSAVSFLTVLTFFLTGLTSSSSDEPPSKPPLRFFALVHVIQSTRATHLI